MREKSHHINEAPAEKHCNRVLSQIAATVVRQRTPFSHFVPVTKLHYRLDCRSAPVRQFHL
jgi:hypothetical protein